MLRAGSGALPMYMRPRRRAASAPCSIEAFVENKLAETWASWPPEKASLSSRSCPRLPQASASLGQPAAWAGQAIPGLVSTEIAASKTTVDGDTFWRASVDRWWMRPSRVVVSQASRSGESVLAGRARPPLCRFWKLWRVASGGWPVVWLCPRASHPKASAATEHATMA